MRTIFVVSGPAGSGKTTVATYLSKTLEMPYLEGDDVRHLTESQLAISLIHVNMSSITPNPTRPK